MRASEAEIVRRVERATAGDQAAVLDVEREIAIATWFLGFLATLLTDVMSAVQWFAKMGPAAQALGVFIGILAAAFTLYRADVIAGAIAQAAFNAVMDANPIALVIIAIAALVAGIVYAYNKVGWFRKDLQAVWAWMKGAAIDTAKWVVNAFGNVLRFFEGLPHTISHLASSMWSGLKSGLVAALNFIIGAINTVINGYNSVVGSIPFVGGDLKIKPLGMIGTSSSKHSTAQVASSTRAKAAQLARARTTTKAFTDPLAPVAHTGQGPLIVHGDIVIRARENELGRVTRRQIQKAMTS